MRAMSPRVLAIDLGDVGRARVQLSEPAEPALATVASWGGSALGLARLVERVRADPAASAPLVLAAGEAVREALPTAARASVLSRAPLSGLFSEGHVGGSLGPRLAAVTDALELRGRTERPGSVLVVGGDCTCELHERAELLGASPASTVENLERELGPCAVLAIGPAGERGLPFASLASGFDPPSFVGRGGLGAVLGRMGLKAICIAGRPGPRGERGRSGALVGLLSSSPRLAARAEGGTFELFGAFAARGDLRTFDGPVPPEQGSALAREARERALERKGCRGCPTPCGWVFERAGGVRQGARFGASYALGLQLGLGELEDALHLLALCDRLGIDAKEVGAILALVCRAQERGLLPGRPAWGEVAELSRRIESLVFDERSPGRAGSAVLARELGLADEFPASRGQAARPESSAASLLGQCVASGGADPMRSFPFLVESASHELLERLLAPIPLPYSALDPESPCGKGRLVFWHENLISAVDMTGFCAFSAAGLLSDGLADLDRLAQWILPEALREPHDPLWRSLASGERLLAAGANLVLLRRELNRMWGAEPDQDRPRWARERLERPGMLDEYLLLRGLDQGGIPRAEVVGLLGTPEVIRQGYAQLAPAPLARHSGELRALPEQRRRGRVELRSVGPLARALGGERELELELPATLAQVLERASQSDALLRAQLFAGERVIPSVWRAGRRLMPDDAIESGDVLELVTAISGG